MILERSIKQPHKLHRGVLDCSPDLTIDSKLQILLGGYLALVGGYLWRMLTFSGVYFGRMRLGSEVRKLFLEGSGVRALKQPVSCP